MSTQRVLGVVGAGNMGSGIAQKLATEGFNVVLVDLTPEALARGMAMKRSKPPWIWHSTMKSQP